MQVAGNPEQKERPMKCPYGLAAVALLWPAVVFAAGSDAEFAEKAAIGNQLEVELGELATENAESDEVKSFGERMVEDHSQAQDLLEEVAGEANVELPDDLDEKAQQTMDKLSGLSGSEFDQAYMEEMVKDHEKAVELYEQQAEAADSAFKTYAEQILPSLREHSEMAQKIHEGMQ